MCYSLCTLCVTFSAEPNCLYKQQPVKISDFRYLISCIYERWSVHSNPVATSQSYLETNRRLTAATGLQCLRQSAPSTRK